VILASDGQNLRAPKLARRKVRYEQIIIDSNYKRFRKRFKTVSAGFFTHFLKGSAITKSKLSNNYRSQLDPFKEKLNIKDGGFTVAFVENNRPHSDKAMNFPSEILANQYIENQISIQPGLHDTLHVIPQYEVNTRS
jgi:hypothetical protein